MLRAQVAEHHDWTLAQHAAALTATTGILIKKPSVGNYLNVWGLRTKKRFVAARDEAARASYRAEVETKAAGQLVFIDETSAYVGQSRGRALSGSRTRLKAKKRGSV